MTPEQLWPHFLWLLAAIVVGAAAVSIFKILRGRGTVRMKALLISFGALVLIWVLFVCAIFAVEYLVRKPLFH